LLPLWSTICTSLPRFEVSCDVGSGTRDLGCDISDLKTSGNFASELSTFSWKCRKGALLLFVTTLMIQKTTSVFLNLRHRHQSHGHFEHIILVISSRGWQQENRILNFVKICKKIAFYPNWKIFPQKFIRWNAELDERNFFFLTLWALSEFKSVLKWAAKYLFVDTASKIDRHLLSTVGSTEFFLFTNTVN